MKRILSALLLSLLLPLLLLPVSAAEPSYTMSLSANGESELHVRSGDTITVVFTLQRSDENSNSVIYGVQNEISYDPAFFEMLENSTVLTPGVESVDITKVDGDKSCIMAYLSLGSGTTWSPKTAVGSLRFRVLAQCGSAQISCCHAKVFLPDGSGSYPLQTENLKVFIGGEVTVSFEANGGSETASQSVELGQRIARPADPEREGYSFSGWYRDEDCTLLWDFENDTVEEEMTLYAGWTEKSSSLWLLWSALGLLSLGVLAALLLRRKTVHFDTDGGTEIADVHLRRGEKLELPMNPEKSGHVFRGWYKEKDYVNLWDFANDCVETDMTLYARWL